MGGGGIGRGRESPSPFELKKQEVALRMLPLVQRRLSAASYFFFLPLAFFFAMDILPLALPRVYLDGYPAVAHNSSPPYLDYPPPCLHNP